MRPFRLPRAGFGRLPRAAAAAVALLPASEAGAVASRHLSVAVHGSNGYSRNPFLAHGDDSGAGYIEFGIQPRYTLAQERGEAVFEASLRATQYLSRYGGSHAYGARVSARHAFSEALEMRGGIGAESSIVGSRSALSLEDRRPGLTSNDSVQTVAPSADDGVEQSEDSSSDDGFVDSIEPDLGLLGEQGRRNRAHAFLGLNFRANPDETLDLNLTAERSGVPGSRDAANLTGLSGNFSYSRRLSAVAEAGLAVGIQRTEFGRGLGTSTVYQPQLFYSGRVSPGWSFRVGAGGLFVHSNAPGLPTSRLSGISVDLGACREIVRLSACFGANRGAQESARGDVSERTSFFTRLSYRLGPHEDIRLAGAIGKTGQAVRGLVEDRRQLAAEASYRLRLRERLEIGATVGYRDLYGINRPIQADLSARVSLSVRFDR